MSKNFRSRVGRILTFGERLLAGSFTPDPGVKNDLRSGLLVLGVVASAPHGEPLEVIG